MYKDMITSYNLVPSLDFTGNLFLTSPAQNQSFGLNQASSVDQMEISWEADGLGF